MVELDGLIDRLKRTFQVDSAMHFACFTDELNNELGALVQAEQRGGSAG